MAPPKRTGDADTNGDSKRAKTELNDDDISSSEEAENSSSEVEEVEDSADGTKDEAEDKKKPLPGPDEPCGELLFCGATNWDMIGRKAPPKGSKAAGGPNLWGPHRIGQLKDVKIRNVASGPVSAHCIAITSEGTVYTWGRNENGQLGHGHTNKSDAPTIVEALDDENVVAAASGRRHTLFLTDKGKVFSCGENKMGQLGLGNQSSQVTVPTQINYKGPPIRRIACGGEFSVIADIKGNVYTFGCPEYGQLGHNTDGKFFITSSKLEFQCENSPRVITVFVEKARDGQVTPITDVDVREITCGQNHVLIIDSKKRVFSWGFGGYGRLGHSDPKDVMVPQMIQFFNGPNRGAVSIAAGSTYSLAVSEHGALYFWGVAKSSGEATMYPKLVQDLSGWKIRCMGTSFKSIVVAADESVVSWGPSPCYGELGYGDNSNIKSSTNPKEVKPLENVYIHKVACGYSHTLMIARCDTDEEQEEVEKFPVYKP